MILFKSHQKRTVMAIEMETDPSDYKYVHAYMLAKSEVM